MGPMGAREDVPSAQEGADAVDGRCWRNEARPVSVRPVGRGRVFYFRAGHETFPVFQQAEPLRVLENAARWLAPEK